MMDPEDCSAAGGTRRKAYAISVACSGWGTAAAMNPWTRDVLTDLAAAFKACTGSAVSCHCGERRNVPFTSSQPQQPQLCFVHLI